MPALLPTLGDPLRRISGEELEKVLRDRNLSQQTLADILGMSQPNISLWMAGKFSPGPAFHIAVRLMSEEKGSGQIYPKKKKGRPFSPGFPLEKARCPHPDCRRGNRQMHREREAFDHPILGKVQPVFCTGSHAQRHPRVTRWLDRRRGRLWDASDWPHRRKLATFEAKRIKETLDVMGDVAEHDRVLNCLARCTAALNGKRGCGGFLINDGHPSSRVSKTLYAFYCAREGCQLQWRRRYFTALGKELPANPIGSPGGERGCALPIPPGARLCPVTGCGARLNSPKGVSVVGGEHYSPPLLKLWCPNPKNISHRSPHRSRSGRSFYYDKKRSQFVQVYSRARKQRGPVFSQPCKRHGRMNRSEFNSIDRVPMRVRAKLGIDKLKKLDAPVYRDYCLCTEVWMTADGRKTNRMRNHWKTARPFRTIRPMPIQVLA